MRVSKYGLRSAIYENHRDFERTVNEHVRIYRDGYFVERRDRTRNRDLAGVRIY